MDIIGTPDPIALINPILFLSPLKRSRTSLQILQSFYNDSILKCPAILNLASGNSRNLSHFEDQLRVSQDRDVGIMSCNY